MPNEELCNASSSNTISGTNKVIIKSPEVLNNSSLNALSVYCDSSTEDEADGSDTIEERTIVKESGSSIPGDNDSAICVNPFNLSPSVTENAEDFVSVSSSSTALNELLSDESDFCYSSDEHIECPQPKKTGPCRMVTKGELTLDDLPPIKDLRISVPEDQCAVLGTITSIVDKLVVVQGIKDLPPLDLDTVLFLEPNKPPGSVFDVFGPVLEPLYCVRFNSDAHMKEKEVAVGKPVYFVPTSRHTKYVFLTHLLRVKGSDASWEHNNEPPPECLDYSDDEEERKAIKSLRKKAIRGTTNSTTETPVEKQYMLNRAMNGKKDGPFKKSKNRRNNQWSNRNSVVRTPVFEPPSTSIFECKPSAFQLQVYASSFTHPQFPNVPAPSPQQFLRGPLMSGHRTDTSIPPPMLPTLNTYIMPPALCSAAPNMSRPPPVISSTSTSPMLRTIPHATPNLSVPPPIAPNLSVPPPGTNRTPPGIPNMFNTPPPAIPGTAGPPPFHCTSPPPFSHRHFPNNSNENRLFSFSGSFTPPQSSFGFNNNTHTPTIPPRKQGSRSNKPNFNQWQWR